MYSFKYLCKILLNRFVSLRKFFSCFNSHKLEFSARSINYRSCVYHIQYVLLYHSIEHGLSNTFEKLFLILNSDSNASSTCSSSG